MDTERQISQHYAHGSLERTIFDAAKAAGIDTEHPSHVDLSAVDEHHIGGRQATIDFAAQLKPARGSHLLDVGCGLGGASRYFAAELGCRVSGIDLTEEYVRVAEALSKKSGLSGQVSYRQASALALPFAAGTFDGAYMIHVGMNIPDKAKLFAEVKRVLKPGAPFGIYDVMRESDGAFNYPVPWAATAETNFIESPATYKRLLADARFEVVKERNRREFAMEFFKQLRARMAQSGPPKLGQHLVMGATAPQMVANVVALVGQGTASPTEIIARAI